MAWCAQELIDTPSLTGCDVVTPSPFRGNTANRPAVQVASRGRMGLQSTFPQAPFPPGMACLLTSRPKPEAPLPVAQGPPFLQNLPCDALRALQTQSPTTTEEVRDGKQILHLRVKEPEALVRLSD